MVAAPIVFGEADVDRLLYLVDENGIVPTELST